MLKEIHRARGDYMSKLFHFFFSFDKLLKEGLVRAAFWLGLLNLALLFMAEMLGAIKLEWFAALFDFLFFFARFLFYVVALRIIAELAIAIFRINDNISPDGGKSETADIDPVAEAKKAAELAARRAQEATKSAVDKTSTATKSAASDVRTTLKTNKPQIKPVAKKKATAKASTQSTAQRTRPKRSPSKTSSKTAPKTAAAKKPATKTPATKKTTPRKTAAKKATVKKTTASKTTTKRRPGYKLDGTPRKKPGPKPKSKS
jgi:hypothetical protein